MSDLPPEARSVLETIREMVEELPDRRDAIYQADLNQKLNRADLADRDTDRIVAELVAAEMIEPAGPVLPGMTGPSSFRYRLDT